MRRANVLVPGVSVGVIHQFLGIVKTALQERVAEIWFWKIRIITNFFLFFLTFNETPSEGNVSVCRARTVSYLQGWSEQEPGRCPAQGRQREAFLKKKKYYRYIFIHTYTYIHINIFLDDQAS